MPSLMLEPDRSALLVIDVQTGLVPFIQDVEHTLDRIAFLLRMARLLDIPILATEQNPAKMGPTHERVRIGLANSPVFPKMEFGAHRSAECLAAIRASGRRQVVVVGFETHICIAQTAKGLRDLGFDVAVCPDGVSARSLDRHKLGMEQIRDAGVVPAHTEAVAYEWLGTASHPKFRDALAIVKAHL